MLSSKKIFHANQIDNIYNEKAKNIYPYIVRKTTDNGLKGYIKEDEQYLNDGGTLSFAQDTFTVYFQKEKFFTGNKVKILKPKFSSVKYGVMITLTALLQKRLEKLSWGDGSTVESIKKTNFYLPTKDGEIDFEFMEDFVAELEAQRVAELEAYLTVTGLKDYELTEEEEVALQNLENREWGEYRIGDLFEIKPTKAYKYTNKDLFQKQGMYPVVTNSSINNGITGYTNLLPTEQGNMITYSDTTTSEGIFYQPRDFVGYSHIQGLYPILNKEKWNYYSLIYFVTHFKKCAEGKFDYGNKFNRKIASSMIVQLPTKNNQIDFEYMETLISAIQKLVIEDIVLWADKKIDTTKQVINKN